DGRIIKAINKGIHKVESVVIEDLQVLPVGDPVVNLKDKVVSIPLHRCDRATTCSACVGLQDPYCVWDDTLKCINAHTGLQSISTGKHTTCDYETNAGPNYFYKKLVACLGLISASTTGQAAGLAIEIVILAVIVSIIGSLILGFFMGFTFQACRYARDRDVFSDKNYSSLQRCRNRLSSGDNPYFHTDHSNLTSKTDELPGQPRQD
ncbi:unnamed protein product, partial [Candidula unifasciata]